MTDRSYHNQEAIQAFIKLAIQEDVGDGDITTLATFNNDAIGMANCYVKENCTLAGVSLAIDICKCVDPTLKVSFMYVDGDDIKQAPVCVGKIIGKLSSILRAERIILNCMQRMTGIATVTKQFVALAKNKNIAIYDTRKTTPNFRLPEKWAVVIGGGVNHRFGLDDQILIKDNHIKAAGGILQALDNCVQYSRQQNATIPVIVEVQHEEEFLTAIQHKIVNRVLIDNHTPELLEKYIHYRNSMAPDKKLEISGGITIENIKPYLILGIDCISVGALTHQVRSIDISLKLV